MIFFYIYLISFLFFFFFFNDPAPPEIYTLPLHDALPISVDDVGVPDCPAEVGGGPVDFARLDAVDVRHCPLERDGVTAVVAHDALRHPRRTRRIEDVERIGRGDRHALRASRRRHQLRPVAVAPDNHGGPFLRPLKNDAATRLHRGELDRLVEQRLVRNDAIHLDAARGGDDHRRLCVTDARRELVRGEAPEYD